MKTALFTIGTLFMVIGLSAFLWTWVVGMPNVISEIDRPVVAVDADLAMARPIVPPVPGVKSAQSDLVFVLWFVGICGVLAVWGYHVAKADQWSAIIGFIICGGVFAPLLYLIGWVLLHELRYQLALEKVELPKPGDPIYYRVTAVRPYLMGLFL